MHRSTLLLAAAGALAASALVGSLGWVRASSDSPAQVHESPAEDRGACAYRQNHTSRGSALHFLLRDTSSSLR